MVCNRSINQSWTDLKGDKVIGLKDITIIPPSTDITYIDATNDRQRGMIEGLKLFNCLNTVQMMENIVIPSLRRGDYGGCPPDLLEMLLRNFYHYSADAQTSMATLPIIPLDMRGLGQPLQYSAATNLIDPAATDLREIFFDDEFFHPEAQIYQNFVGPLMKCGLKKELDRTIVLDRLNTYASNRYSWRRLSLRVKALLQMPMSGELKRDANFHQIISEKCWLPALNEDRTHQLTEPKNCRDQNDFHLVGHVMPTLPFEVGPVWRLCFHWQDPITADRLVSQLAFGIEKSDLQIVNTVLSYMARSSQRPLYLQRMKGLNFVWTSEERFVTPNIACQDGCHRLVPYFHNIDPRFWSIHSKILLDLGAHSSLTSRQLLEVQQQLESTSPLSDSDLEVALEVTRLVSLDTKSSFASLKIPSDKGVLVRATEIAFNDLGPSDLPDDVFLTHRGISREIVDRLQIEPLSERLLKGKLGISDFDEEEFDQREEVTDGIRDTLERYPKELTLHEYLANADDCGSASEVNWLLDETTYPGRSLIRPELADYQGPSLLVHNDGGM
jgi:sacsin